MQRISKEVIEHLKHYRSGVNSDVYYLTENTVAKDVISPNDAFPYLYELSDDQLHDWNMPQFNRELSNHEERIYVMKFYRRAPMMIWNDISFDDYNYVNDRGVRALTNPDESHMKGLHEIHNRLSKSVLYNAFGGLFETFNYLWLKGIKVTMDICPDNLRMDENHKLIWVDPFGKKLKELKDYEKNITN